MDIIPQKILELRSKDPYELKPPSPLPPKKKKKALKKLI